MFFSEFKPFFMCNVVKKEPYDRTLKHLFDGKKNDGFMSLIGVALIRSRKRKG